MSYRAPLLDPPPKRREWPCRVGLLLLIAFTLYVIATAVR